MAWYDTGTVAVTNGSTTVTGTGTNFITGAQAGEAFYGPDDKLYEIASITSATVLVLADNYLGSTQSGQDYKIVPTQSLVADLASDVTDLIADYADVKDKAGAGKFNDGSVTAPGITFEQDQNNGLYRIGSDNWALSAGGEKIVDVSTNGIKLDDNNKATFGTGDDLQIYHDGTHSYIDDVGTGSLQIRGTNLNLKGANNEAYVACVENGQVELYHDNSKKLATTSTGVDVTGTVTADGLTVDGTGTAIEVKGNNTAQSENNTLRFTDIDASTGTNQQTGKIEFYTSDATNTGVGAYIASNSISSTGLQYMSFATGTPPNPLTRMKIREQGNVEFYEDTGTTAKMVWSSSDESLNITGAASSSTALSVSNNHNNVMTVTQTDTSLSNDVYTFEVDSSTHTSNMSSAGAMAVDVNSGRAFTINGFGRAGFGTASPTAKIHLDGTGTTDTKVQMSSGSGLSSIDGRYGNLIISADENNAVTGSVMSFRMDNSEAMRIDSSRNLRVGNTSTELSTTGGRMLADGRIIAVADGKTCFTARRLTSEGDMSTFVNNNGVTMGSIRSDGGTILQLNADATDKGVFLSKAGANIVGFAPNETNVFRPAGDNVCDLGKTDRRFKDLYLSGGVYLGGTGSANKLDDYETGNWTPTMSASGATITFTEQFGRYVKIGDVVHVQARITVGTVSGGAGAVLFGSLPFTSDAGSYYNSALSVVRLANFNIDISAGLQNIMVIQGQDFGYLYFSDNTTGNTNTLNIGGLKGGSTLVFSGTYKVA